MLYKYGKRTGDFLGAFFKFYFSFQYIFFFWGGGAEGEVIIKQLFRSSLLDMRW